ncbi:endonuclease domain-containing protein [Streptomyces sp. NPDC091267]|uniref:endonuclease domain-containing protein n=1 Tax=Streptomyces sp. NPDC091267 TaxID=3155195 RepID=UPI0034276819
MTRPRGTVWNRAGRYGLADSVALELRARPCDICGTEPTPDTPHGVDHCHETGRVRGVLCRSCNLALGHFRDDPERVLKAARYLSKPDTDYRRVDRQAIDSLPPD